MSIVTLVAVNVVVAVWCGISLALLKRDCSFVLKNKEEERFLFLAAAKPV